MTQDQISPVTTDRSPTTVALDNLIRRKLRVSNPNDPSEVAQALKRVYAKESEALKLEAEGVPFFRITKLETVVEADTSTRAELKQAVDDVERDLGSLISNSLLKDIHPELRGWASAIRAAVAEGTNAARFALDPRQRDKSMGARRLLGDYARAARYVGALTPNMSPYYRRLAQSLDEVSAVILVLMGDAIAGTGFGGSRSLLQAPASELQERRDAVIFALRNLVGSVQESYGPHDWPRGLAAYREFLERLDRNGQSDLRALFQENNLAQLMDELIDRAASSNADGLRALSATAQMALQRFRRLIMFGHRLVEPESPPLAAFLTALQLFLNAFDNAGSGSRLLFMSRPPVVFYGLYGIGGPDTATQRLLRLVIARGQLAEMADCYLGCDCSDARVQCQVMLDKVLYDLDRAIDLYALGTDPNGDGEPEQRAAAYGVVVDRLLHALLTTSENREVRCFEPQSDLDQLLTAVRTLLWYRGNGDTVASSDFTELEIDNLRHELCTQRDAESQWESLLHTMAPSCLLSNGALTAVRNLIDAALSILGGECVRFEVDIPPDVATSVAGFTYLRDSRGGR
jgi:hypothetical protein